MVTRNTPIQEVRPSLTRWLERALATMPAQGRLLLKAPQELAFGFTDDRKTEKGNQDRALIAYCLDPAHCGEPWFFAGICDGVGGQPQGEIAASIALAEILSELCVGGSDAPSRRMEKATLRAHAAVRQRLRGSATTFAGVLLSARGTLTIGAVGDSRIYALSNEVVKLSQDDTLEQMLQRQAPDANDAQLREVLQGLAPQWKDSLGQAIGSELPLKPQIDTLSHAKDIAGCLLCTDGVWKTVQHVLEQVVAASGDRQDLARRLLNLTEVLRATDNATAIVIPDVPNVLRWLRSMHSPDERGLVHVVLPTESIVAPWTFFERASFAQTPIPQVLNDDVHHPRASKAKAKSKAKSKSRKPSDGENDPGIQLTIEEETRHEPADTSSSVSKNH